MVRGEGLPSSKESRQKKVKEHQRVVLLIGDNRNDFKDDFAGKSIADLAAQVDRERADFGMRFIV
jgi:predicted secreted acid phosphatase